VQMCAEGTDGGRCFFKCPQAWVILTSTSLLNMVLLFRICNTTLLLQSYTAPENCEFARWVDPAPIHPHQEYIYYLQNRIFDLEMAVSSGEPDALAGSQEAPCTIADCATVLVTRTRRHHPHPCRRLLWEDTMEKV